MCFDFFLIVHAYIYSIMFSKIAFFICQMTLKLSFLSSGRRLLLIHKVSPLFILTLLHVSIIASFFLFLYLENSSNKTHLINGNLKEEFFDMCGYYFIYYIVLSWVKKNPQKTP